MRIPSGTTDQYIYFVAVDETDFTTRETGLSSFTVYRSRDGGAAAAMTTPTINETDATNMPGVYELLLDEDMTIGASNESEEMSFHITHAGMAPVTRTIELYSNETLVDEIWDEVLTNATHNVANSSGRRLRELQESGAAYGGFVWIDTVNGTAGTTSYVNGTSDNPVDSIADANTIAAAVGISRFRVAPGSSITFAATQSNQAFFGANWTLALGSQSIAGTYIEGATMSGVATGSDYHFEHCHVGNVTLADGDILHSSIDGTITASAAGTYLMDSCFSGIAGSGTPSFDFGAAVGNTALNMRHYSGGIEIDNKDQTGSDTMSLEGNGQLIVAATSSGAISLRGNFKVTNTGGATITYDDNTQGIVDVNTDTDTIITNLATTDGKVDTIDANVDAILLDTGTDGVVISAATQTAIADALLNRDMSAVSDTTARSPLNALRLLRNKYSIAGTTLTVTKEDDSTSAWTSTLTTDAAADPVTGSDPA